MDDDPRPRQGRADDVKGSGPRRGRDIVQGLGSVVSLVAVAFVIVRVWDHGDALLTSIRPRHLALVVLPGATLYAVASLALSIAWHRLVQLYGSTHLRWSEAHRINARTSVAKYLPGNFLHLLGRHGLARGYGVPHSTLIAAAVHEAASLIGVAGFLALCGLAVSGSRGELPAVEAVVGLTACGILVPLALLYLTRRLSRSIPPVKHLPLRDRAGRPAWVCGLHLLFFAAAGGILAALPAALLAPEVQAPAGSLVLAFATAWIVGFVTPGAPGGLGVREAVMVTLLAPSIGEQQALVVALAFRAITLLGDVLFFLSSFAVADEAGRRAGTIHRAHG